MKVDRVVVTWRIIQNFVLFRGPAVYRLLLVGFELFSLNPYT